MLYTAHRAVYTVSYNNVILRNFMTGKPFALLVTCHFHACALKFKQIENIVQTPRVFIFAFGRFIAGIYKFHLLVA
jgi:hypothetical protein